MKAIAALLEAEHPDVESLAKAVIAELDAVRQTRAHYTVVLSWSDAERFAAGVYPDRQAAYYGARRIAPDAPEEVLRASVREIKPTDWWTPAPEEARKGQCSECGHPTHTHNWPKYRRKMTGCVVSLTPRGEPGANLCPCTGDGKS